LTENEIIDLLGELQRTESFGFVLVTHRLELARRAQRTYEMRQGALVPAELPQPALAAPRRPSRPPPAAPAMPPARRSAPASVRLGSNLLPALQTFLMSAAVVLGAILVADFAIARYQDLQLRERASRIAALRHLALNGLRGDVQSVIDLGGGRYELTTYLQNVGAAPPLSLMTPTLPPYLHTAPLYH